MNRIFLSFDGDGIGRLVGVSILQDDVQGLHDISNKIEQANQAMKQWVLSHNGKMISGGGGEGTAMFENIQDEESFLDSIEQMRDQYLQITGSTLTIGAGLTLSQAGKALLAGKLSGKDQVLIYDQDTEDLLHNAHDNAAAGHATDDEQKNDDHYLSQIYGDDENPDQDDSEMVDDENPEMSDDDMIDADPQDESNSEQMSDDIPEEDSNEETTQEDGQMIEDQPSEEEVPEEEMNDDQDNIDDNSLLADENEPSDGSDLTDEQMQTEEGAKALEDESPEMSDDQDDIMQAPEEQDQEFQPDQEETIEIPENEHLPDPNKNNDDDTEKDEMSPEMVDDEDPEMSDEMVASPANENNEDLKQKCAETLMSFKDQKENLKAIAEQAPELYQATIAMLQCMIEMSRTLFPDGEEQMPQEEVQEDPKI